MLKRHKQEIFQFIHYARLLIVKFSFFLLIVMTTSCAQKTILFNSKAINEEQIETTSIETYYFFDGLGKDQIIRVSDICPKGIYSIENNKGFFDVVVGMITVGIVTPRTITFRCIKD